MMVKNQTSHDVFVGGSRVPADGEFHQVKDDPGVRELLKEGVLSKQESQSRSKSNNGGDS